MSNTHPDLPAPSYTYDQIQTHVARGRALRAAYMAHALRRVGRRLIGRGHQAHKPSGAHPA